MKKELAADQFCLFYKGEKNKRRKHFSPCIQWFTTFNTWVW